MIEFIKSKYFRKPCKRGLNFQQFNNEQFTLEFDITKSDLSLNEPERSKIQVSTLSYPPVASQPHASASIACQEDLDNVKNESNTTSLDFDFNYTPPKGDFFLYTIAEHQMLTNKTFGYKKRLYSSFLSRNLSKSDSNIAAKHRQVIAPGGALENKSFDKSSVFV